MASIGNAQRVGRMYQLPQPYAAYYFFPWNVQQDDSAEKPKPTCTLDVMKIHEEAVEKVLADMPQIQKLIIYRQLHALGVKMEGIDRAIHKEAQKELKAASAP